MKVNANSLYQTPTGPPAHLSLILMPPNTSTFSALSTLLLQFPNYCQYHYRRRQIQQLPIFPLGGTAV